MGPEVKTKLSREDVLTMHVTYVSSLLRSFENSHFSRNENATDVRTSLLLPESLDVLNDALFSNAFIPESKLTFIDAVRKDTAVQESAVNVCVDVINFLEGAYRGTVAPEAEDVGSLPELYNKAHQKMVGKVREIYKRLVGRKINFILERVLDGNSDENSPISQASMALTKFLNGV